MCEDEKAMYEVIEAGMVRKQRMVQSGSVNGFAI